jgi:hypothetical protein
MNHYLSDFFCLPHTDGYLGTKVYHGLYELFMVARYRKGLNASRAMLKKENALLKPEELKDFILEKSKLYAGKKSSGVNDIRFALFAGTKMSQCIVVHSVVFSELETARNLQAV